MYPVLSGNPLRHRLRWFWLPSLVLVNVTIFTITITAHRVSAQTLDFPPSPTETLSATQPIEAAATTLTVNPRNRQESLEFFRMYHEVPTPDAQWQGDPGQCQAGEVSAEFRAAIALRINYFRAMAGVPANVTLDEEFSRKAQQAAMMMSANGQLNHNPPADWHCYNEDGAAAAGSSNLYLGVYGPDAIDGYMRDPGDGNYFVGHRRWILYPQTQQMGSGDLPAGSTHSAANALWVFDQHTWETRPPTRDGYVTWPPAGFVPYQLIFPKWSFAYPGADFADATVAMTNGSGVVALSQAEVVTGFGENTLVWMPNDATLQRVHTATADTALADTAYTVVIDNVLINGEPRSFRYAVTIFDPAHEIAPPQLTVQAFIPMVLH